MYCIVLYCIVLYCIVLYCIVLYLSMRSIDARNLGYGVTSARPYLVTSRTSARTDFPNSPNIGTGEGSVRAIFLGRKSCGSVALATGVFLAGNHISDERRGDEI